MKYVIVAEYENREEELVDVEILDKVSGSCEEAIKDVFWHFLHSGKTDIELHAFGCEVYKGGVNFDYQEGRTIYELKGVE